MFAQTFVDTQSATRKPWTVAASLGVQSLVVVALLLVPLLHPEVLTPKLEMPVWVRVRLTPEPPPVQAKSSAVRQLSATPVFTAPQSIPRKVATIVDSNLEAPDAPGIYVPGASQAGLTGLGAIGIPVMLPETFVVQKPAPRAVQPRVPEGPLHVSSGVQSARLLFGPKPAYPQMAKAARMQGTVRLQAVIAIDGHISGLQVMGGPSLLIKAAMDAVGQWRYQPTLLNNAPVEVLTEIDVIFTLN